MKLFLVYGVDKSDDYPLIKLYGVFSSKDRAFNFIGRKQRKMKNDNEKFWFKAFELDKLWDFELKT